jgi:hypothetical protein
MASKYGEPYFDSFPNSLAYLAFNEAVKMIAHESGLDNQDILPKEWIIMS